MVVNLRAQQCQTALVQARRRQHSIVDASLRKHEHIVNHNSLAHRQLRCVRLRNRRTHHNRHTHRGAVHCKVDAVRVRHILNIRQFRHVRRRRHHKELARKRRPNRRRVQHQRIKRNHQWSVRRRQHIHRHRQRSTCARRVRHVVVGRRLAQSRH